jgi:hypothetical protein
MSTHEIQKQDEQQEKQEQGAPESVQLEAATRIIELVDNAVDDIASTRVIPLSGQGWTLEADTHFMDIEQAQAEGRNAPGEKMVSTIRVMFNGEKKSEIIVTGLPDGYSSESDREKGITNAMRVRAFDNYWEGECGDRPVATYFRDRNEALDKQASSVGGLFDKVMVLLETGSPATASLIRFMVEAGIMDKSDAVGHIESAARSAKEQIEKKQRG